jgi:GT2 family glycosyltransferase/glycosyltransferase involved in cell wall biosynthesis
VGCDVSIIIPVLNKLEFTRQCLDSIHRQTDEAVSYEVIIVDNGSTDGTAEWMVGSAPIPVRYHRNPTNLGFSKANNIGAQLASGTWLLFLNNDTLARPGWLTEMVRIPRTDPSVGIVGIKQLFPYTNTIYHTGIVFTPEGRPEHLYPHLDASLPQVNKQREYQAVTGACLLIDRPLFDACGGFDEEYRNGYEDVDLCMQVKARGRKIVCCTKSYIFHYGQISEGRTADDETNAARFAKKWAGKIKPDRDDYLIRDRADGRPPTPKSAMRRVLADDCIYFADALDDGSALTWINAELALALHTRGVEVFVNGGKGLSPTLTSSRHRTLQSIALKEVPVGGIQVKWSHYRPQHLDLDLSGSINLEFFVINYLFGTTTAEPWDYWLQCLRQDGYDKLPLSEFCNQVLDQVGVSTAQRHVWYPGYSPEIAAVETSTKRRSRFRFLTVTNSHDLERYNTAAVIDAFEQAFTRDDAVELVVKDYGASSGDATIRRRLLGRSGGPEISYNPEFQDKNALILLYRSSDALVSAHRGEGFGMKILDAMACGLPIIAPLFGGSTSYCTAENSFPVEFSLVPMGRCLDTLSLHITNRPMWAEVNTADLARQLRAVYENRDAARARGDAGRVSVEQRFSWDSSAARLLEIAKTVKERSRARTPATTTAIPAKAERSPYWLGLRVSVVIPTHNRKEKLMACLDALARQSVLPQEFEVIVVDDGSSDGTREAVADRRFPFALRYFHQEPSGPGAARNLAIAHAAGELVLFIGDDIMADARLLEEHLLAHAPRPDTGVAILGHIDWPPSMPSNAVMDYVCGDAMLQFAYNYIPHAVTLDHRFFYTSNISLKRSFLAEAAAAGITFDSAFRHAAFEDSEFALRLMPRGLKIQYAAGARAYHDHWMDLASFSAREFGAGQMAVVFYRKHPGQDPQLLVRWIADLVEPSSALLAGTDGFLARLEGFDEQTDVLLRSLAGSLEQLLAIEGRPASGPPVTLSAGRLRAALHNVLRTIFDVQRTRGKITEWFANVDDPSKARAAQTLASVMRKIEFLNVDAEALGPLGSTVLPIDRGAVADLSGRLAAVEGMAALSADRPSGPVPQGIKRRLRRLIVNPFLLSRARQADRFIEARFQSWHQERWLERYRRVRRRLRDMV